MGNQIPKNDLPIKFVRKEPGVYASIIKVQPGPDQPTVPVLTIRRSATRQGPRWEVITHDGRNVIAMQGLGIATAPTLEWAIRDLHHVIGRSICQAFQVLSWLRQEQEAQQKREEDESMRFGMRLIYDLVLVYGHDFVGEELPKHREDLRRAMRCIHQMAWSTTETRQ